MLNKLKKGQRELSQQLSRTPTFKELADHLELPIHEVRDLFARASQPISLGIQVGEGEDTTLLDLLPSQNQLLEEDIERDCMRNDLETILSNLTMLQQRVLRMRYGMDGDEPMTLTGIGRVLGISRDRVRKLEKDGLKAMRQSSNSVEDYIAS